MAPPFLPKLRAVKPKLRICRAIRGIAKVVHRANPCVYAGKYCAIACSHGLLRIEAKPEN